MRPKPGEGTDGPSTRSNSPVKGIDFLRGFAGMNIVAVDINTVSPPHDVNGMAAFLAAHMAYESLLLLAGVAAA